MEKILISIIYGLISFGLEFISMLYLVVFLNGTFDDILQRTSKYYATTIFNNMLYFMLVYLAIVLWKFYIDKNKNKYYLFYWLISLYQLTLTGIFVSFSKNYTNLVMWLGLLLVGMSFSVDIIMFFFIQQLYKKQAIEAEMKELYHSHQQNLELYKDIEAQLRTLREQRHEFSNQLQTAYMMINQNAPTEQIEKYLSNIEKQCRSD